MGGGDREGGPAAGRCAARGARQISVSFLDTWWWTIAEGAAFTNREVDEAEPVVLLGRTVRERLFGDGEAVGQDVRIGSFGYHVVRRGVEPATRRQMQAVLRSILCRFAVESGRLTEAPRFPRLPKAGLKIVSTFTEEDVRSVLRVAHPRHRVTFLLAAYAGLRAGEVRGLRWRDVDLAAGHLIVRESICHGEVAAPKKSGHERVVPLVPELRTALQKVRPRERDKFVALNAYGRAWTDGGLLQAFQRAYQRAGLKGWRFHDLRHFFVTALFRKGVAAPTVQALAGHAHLTTTERYAHVARTDLKAAIARLAG